MSHVTTGDHKIYAYWIMLSGLSLSGTGITVLAPQWPLHQEIWPLPPMGKFACIHRGEMAPTLTIDMGKLFPMTWT